MATFSLKYVSKDVDRHGNVRLYFRRRGHKKVRLRAPVGSKEFLSDYSDAMKLVPHDIIPRTDTFGWLCEEYYTKSDEYHAASLNWKVTRKRHMELICAKYSQARYSDLNRKLVLKLRDELKDTPGGKNNLIKHLRGLYTWAVSRELVDTNPTDGIKKIFVSKPFHTATLEELQEYLAYHKAGSKARLGLTLGLYTGLRVSDLAIVGRQHIKDGNIVITPQKTKKSSGIVVTIPILQPLMTELVSVPRDQLAFISKDNGAPYTRESLSSLFKDWFREAGVGDCSAHSLRKGAATIAAENGATENDLMALFGWTTPSQSAVYTREASRKKLAARSAHLISLKQDVK